MKKAVGRSEWMEKLAKVRLSKSELNKLVMNYLVVEGYKEAAEKFAAETKTGTCADIGSIAKRTEIRHAINSGDIPTAIGLVNDLDPEILDSNPILYFRLLQQQFIELVRRGKTIEALEFSQEELAPLGEQNPEILDELEQAMMLLAVGQQSPTRHLLNNAQRYKTASLVNSAILASQCQSQEPKLVSIVRMLEWAEVQLNEYTGHPRLNLDGSFDDGAAESATMSE